MTKKNSSQYENKDNVTQQQKINNTKKVVKIIADVLFYVVLALLIVVLICFAVDKFSGEETYPFFGCRGMVVLSNSMSFKNSEFEDFLSGHDEQFAKGDLVFTRKLKKGEELQVYDIVTFKKGNLTVIHRIVDIYDENGVTYYVTRGDAVPESGTDSAKTIDQITGVYVSSWGKVGIVVKFVQSIYGILAIILCLTILTIAYIIMKYMNNERNKKQNTNQKNDTSSENEISTNDEIVISDNSEGDLNDKDTYNNVGETQSVDDESQNADTTNID